MYRHQYLHLQSKHSYSNVADVTDSQRSNGGGTTSNGQSQPAAAAEAKAGANCLPLQVEQFLSVICEKRKHPQPEPKVKRKLCLLTEEKALALLSEVDNYPGTIRTLNGFISYLLKTKYQSPSTPSPSPSSKSFPTHLQTPTSCSPVSQEKNGGLKITDYYSFASPSKTACASLSQGPSSAPPTTKPVRPFTDLLPLHQPQLQGRPGSSRKFSGKARKMDSSSAMAVTSATHSSVVQTGTIVSAKKAKRRLIMEEEASDEVSLASPVSQNTSIPESTSAFPLLPSSLAGPIGKVSASSETATLESIAMASCPQDVSVGISLNISMPQQNFAHVKEACVSASCPPFPFSLEESVPMAVDSSLPMWEASTPGTSLTVFSEGGFGGEEQGAAHASGNAFKSPEVELLEKEVESFVALTSKASDHTPTVVPPHPDYIAARDLIKAFADGNVIQDLEEVKNALFVLSNFLPVASVSTQSLANFLDDYQKKLSEHARNRDTLSAETSSSDELKILEQDFLKGNEECAQWGRKLVSVTKQLEDLQASAVAQEVECRFVRRAYEQAKAKKLASENRLREKETQTQAVHKHEDSLLSELNVMQIGLKAMLRFLLEL